MQFWWGAFDLAVLLFNGRPAAATKDRGYIMDYDLDAEHLNAGLWPGDESSPQPLFYAYLHPRPDGCETAPIEPDKAGWVEAMGEWMLPYDVVRSSADPRGLVLAFLNSVYRVAVTLGGWDETAHRYTTPPPAGRRAGASAAPSARRLTPGRNPQRQRPAGPPPTHATQPGAEAALRGRHLAHRLLQGRLGQRSQLVHLDDVVELAAGAHGVGVMAELQVLHAQIGLAQRALGHRLDPVGLAHRDEALDGAVRGDAPGEGPVAGQVLNGHQAVLFDVDPALELLAKAERRARAGAELGEAAHEALVLGRLADDLVQRQIDVELAGHLTVVEGHAGARHTLEVLALEAVGEHGLPGRQAHAPLLVARQHAVRVEGKAAAAQALGHVERHEPEELVDRGVVGVGVGEPVVLV